MGVVHCAVLLLHAILSSVHGEFIVIVPGNGFVATVGGDVVLECQLDPDILTRNMVVQWRKSGLTSPVLVYRHGHNDTLVQHQDYRARAELFKDEVAKGNISLRIKNVRRFDEGEYTCSVTEGTEYEISPAELQVRALGSLPRIRLQGYQGDGIQLVCKSGGWYPRPEMLWIGEDGQVLPQAETMYHGDTEGLVNVERNVTVTRQLTNKIKCVVRSRRLNVRHEAIVKISDDIFPGVPGWVLPLVLTICLLIAAHGAVFYWNVKLNRRIKELERRKSIVELEWKRIHGHQVSVTLDVETANPLLEVSEDRKRVRWNGTRRSLPDTTKRFIYWWCVLGLEGFTSGRHYWEVEVAKSRGWRLGVAAESVERKRRVTLTPETGFWSIGRQGDGFDAVTSSPSPLLARPIPGRVGVYLSYESGTVSFYDADSKSHLHAFTGNKFTEKLYPFFWPWNEDEWLTICSGSAPGYEDVKRDYVSVTLDVETAHPELEVSEDRKSVRWTGTERNLSDTGKRFTDCPCVLGSEGFTSGRHYWEVEVAALRWWSLGVAAESVERKQRATLTPETGVWSIKKRCDDEIVAVTSPPSPLPARPIPGRVGVYLSYESGTVSFYDADTKSHLYTFTGNKFTDKRYPFFWPWDEAKWLRICSSSVPGV